MSGFRRLDGGLLDFVGTSDLDGALFDLSPAERAEIIRLSTAINHALAVARGMPTTLDAQARALIVEKLQESEHWMLELVRRGASS